MTDALERAEQGVVLAAGELTVRRAKAWKLRILGYSIHDIAEELNVAVSTAHADVRWCLDNYPPAYETAEDFRRVSLLQLDRQYRMLMDGRLKYDEDGQPVLGADGKQMRDEPNESAQRVAMGVKELAAKMLGALAPREISGDITVRTALELPEGSGSSTI